VIIGVRGVGRIEIFLSKPIAHIRLAIHIPVAGAQDSKAA